MLYERIGLPALLEQTAEECAELAQACLKMARYLRGENPVYRNEESLNHNLSEEMADVDICMRELLDVYDVINPEFMEDIMAASRRKKNRMKKRMAEMDAKK